MNKKIKGIIALLAILICSIVKGQIPKFEKAESFYLDSEMLNKDNISWGYLSVPENWDNSNARVVKVAVSILRNFSNKPDAEAVVFIQGGPGASGIETIWSWINHPLRENNDIVLLDLRGTGFSQPRLCPDLGEEILKILAKNQSEEEDEKQKTRAALSCKQNLLANEVNIRAYNSASISKDLNALKSQLGYKYWNVYAISYGTYVAQVYAAIYPNDIKTLLLDSTISDISSYYTKNTTGYMTSLFKVFKLCDENKECKSNYPDLERIYFEVIEDLEKHPITVSVDKNLVASGDFTFNSEDFKVAIQQALYNKDLIEVIPLLIYQFQNRNEGPLGNLVAAFSKLLNMDYGVYYCTSCTEVLPNNEIIDYHRDAVKYKNLKGGISFYKSDFDVCEKWNSNGRDSLMNHDISQLIKNSFPVLILSGEYDPITPASNGVQAAEKFKNVSAIYGYTYGHTPSFTSIGSKIAKEFIGNPYRKLDLNAYKKASKINLVENVTINPGVAKLGNSLNQLNLILFSPLFVALILMFVFIFIYAAKLVRKRYTNSTDKIIRILCVFTCITGIAGMISLIMSLFQVQGQNHFILAFGLPVEFNYVFIVLKIFLVLLSISLLYFIIFFRKIEDRSIILSVLFSNALLITYLFYWEVF